MKKVVVVTGGTSGIGLACVKELQEEYIVYSLGRSCSRGSEFDIKCDVSKENEVKQAIETIISKHGKINALVNNAGVGLSGAIEFSDMDEVQKMFEVNVFGVLNTIKYCLPHMNKGDKVINISSTLAYFPVPFRSVYGATKSAVNMIGYGLYMECLQFGVQVCNICPAEIKTDFSKNRVENFQTSERYGERIKSSGKGIEKNYHKRKSPNFIANVVLKQLKRKKMKPLLIPEVKFRLLYVLYKFLPISIFLKLTEKMIGGKK